MKLNNYLQGNCYVWLHSSIWSQIKNAMQIRQNFQIHALITDIRNYDTKYSMVTILVGAEAEW